MSSAGLFKLQVKSVYYLSAAEPAASWSRCPAGLQPGSWGDFRCCRPSAGGSAWSNKKGRITVPGVKSHFIQYGLIVLHVFRNNLLKCCHLEINSLPWSLCFVLMLLLRAAEGKQSQILADGGKIPDHCPV